MIQKIKSPKLIIIWFTDFHALNPSTSFKKSWMGLMNRFIRHWSEFNILEFIWQWIKHGNVLNDNFFLWMYSMPLDVSNKLLDLDRLKSDDVSTLRDSTNFYSTYYFNGIDSKNTLDKMNDQQMKNPQFDQSLDIERLKTFPKVVFLGTVSAIASLQRNNTSILVHATYGIINFFK